MFNCFADSDILLLSATEPIDVPFWYAVRVPDLLTIAKWTQVFEKLLIVIPSLLGAPPTNTLRDVPSIDTARDALP